MDSTFFTNSVKKDFICPNGVDLPAELCYNQGDKALRGPLWADLENP